MIGGIFRHLLFAFGAIAVTMGLTVLLGLGAKTLAADPDVYMVELETYLDGEDRQVDAERIMGEIDAVLETDEVDDGARGIFQQSWDAEDSAIGQHAMIHGWTVTLIFLRGLLLVATQ